MGTRPWTLAVLFAASTLAGCVTEEAGPETGTGSSDESIRERIARFEHLKGREYEENVAILSGILRDRAFPLLVEALDSDASARIRAACALTLYSGEDDRAREPLFAAAAKDDNAGVRYTAAYGLCTFRDSRGLPVLFEALRAENPQVRWDANDRLKRVTGLDFAFEATDPPEKRAAAVARWEGWYRDVGPGGASMALRPMGGGPK